MVIGIDPGKGGALALVKAAQVLHVEDTPLIKGTKGKAQYDERGMWSTLKALTERHQVDRIVLEKVSAMPGQGVTSMFTFGQGFGLWLGMLAALPVPYELVTPRRWKKTMLADIPGTDQKARSILAAKRLFPGLELPRKKDHGKAEAVLLAAYGLRNLTT